MRKLWPGLLALGMATAFGIWSWPSLPARVVTHWGASGQPNGWSSSAFAVFLIPAIMLLVSGVLVIAPRIDPKRANFSLHSSSYWLVGNLVVVFIAAIHVLTIGINLGWAIDPARVIGTGAGVLFIVIGNVMSRVRPNWVFGIRTPWTLSSELSWRETHRYGGYCFVLAGAAVLVSGLVWPKALIVVLIGGIAASTLFSLVWSYFAWKRDPAAGGAS